MDTFRTEFEVYELEPAGLHYILPPRNLGRLRVFGYVFIALGIASAIIALLLFAREFIPQLRNNTNWLEVLSYFRNWFGLVGVLAFTAGWLVLFGHSEIKLQHGKLRAIECAGIFRWRYKESAAKVTVLELFDRNFSIYGLPVTQATKADFCVLRAGKINLAPGYPYETCLILAEHLQDHWADALSLKDQAAVPHVIDGTKYAGTEADVWPDEFIVQPSASPIHHADSTDHVMLRIPPVGFDRRTCLSSLNWMILAVVAVVLTGLAVASDAFRGPGAGVFGMLLINLWAVTLVWLVSIVNTMWQHAAIAVAGNRLLIVTKNLFRRKNYEWRRDEVRAVVAASAIPGQDHKPRIELQIRLATDKTIHLFTGRSAQELDWLAAVIRRKLFAATDSAALLNVHKSQPPMPLGT